MMYRANRAQYAEVSFQSIEDDDIVDIALPSMEESSEDGSHHTIYLVSFVSHSLTVSSISPVHITPADVFSTPSQLAGELITLTLLPRSRWQTLLNLEVIQVSKLTHAYCLAFTTSRRLSNEISRRSHRRPQNELLSSFRHCRELNHDLLSRRRTLVGIRRC